jgi:hypothetical protein
MQQIDCNPQFGLRSAPVRGNLFLFEFRNLVREPRHFSLRRIAMHDAFLRGANKVGSASAMAAVARLRSPAAIASSPCGSQSRWNNVKKRLALCRISQNGDDD